jgi:peptidoglycan biosynthesis protein MviN/MurJ (putative lipid II flippase)
VTQVATILAVPACLAPCVVGDLFLSAWVGPEYRDSAKYLVAMLAPLVFEAAVAPVFMALHARGRIGLIAAVHVPVAIGNVAVSLFLGLALKMGPLGFALGNTIALVAKNVALLTYLSRRPDPAIPPAGQVLAPLLRALLGGIPGLALLYLARPWLTGGLAEVIAGGAVGGVLSLVGAALATLGPAGMRGMVDTLLRATRRGAAPPPAPPQ